MSFEEWVSLPELVVLLVLRCLRSPTLLFVLVSLCLSFVLIFLFCPIKVRGGINFYPRPCVHMYVRTSKNYPACVCQIGLMFGLKHYNGQLYTVSFIQVHHISTSLFPGRGIRVLWTYFPCFYLEFFNLLSTSTCIYFFMRQSYFLKPRIYAIMQKLVYR